MIFSVLTACLILYGIALLHQTLPPVALQPEPPQVEVTVKLPEEVSEIPPPPEVKTPIPKPVPEKAPPPVPQKVVRTVPPPAPKPQPIRPTPPAEVTLPQPSRMVPLMPERLAETRSEMPVKKTEMIVAPDPSLPAETSHSNYDRAPKKVAEALPQRRTANIRGTAPSEESIAKATPVRVAARGPTKETLQGGKTVAFGGPGEPNLSPVYTGISSKRYDTPSAGQQMPSKGDRAAVAAHSGEEAEVHSPASGTGSALEERAPDTQGPSAAPAKAVFAGVGFGSEERLSGPATTALKTGTQAAAPLPSGEYDFLDKVAPEDLDPSVMVSLNRLRTCRDPEEEIRLKTRLASMLNRPAICRSGGCLFDIRYQESAYSIHIDLYNYEKRDFKDRCEALSLAVNSCKGRRLNR
jgi:hypothetical protein